MKNPKGNLPRSLALYITVLGIFFGDTFYFAVRLVKAMVMSGFFGVINEVFITENVSLVFSAVICAALLAFGVICKLSSRLEILFLIVCIISLLSIITQIVLFNAPIFVGFKGFVILAVSIAMRLIFSVLTVVFGIWKTVKRVKNEK